MSRGPRQGGVVWPTLLEAGVTTFGWGMLRWVSTGLGRGTLSSDIPAHVEVIKGMWRPLHLK